MGRAILKLKLMLESPHTDVEVIKKEIEKKISELDISIHRSSIEEVAFGLKAIILTLVWPEDKSQAEIESKLGQVNGVRSVEVIDFRRAIG